MSEQSPRKRRWPRRVGIALLVLLLLPFLLFGLIQMPPAKRLLANQASSLASRYGPWPIVVHDIRGLLPFDLRIGHIALGPAAEPWLEVRDLSLELRARTLLQGRVELKLIHAAWIGAHDMPPPSDVVEPVVYAMPALPDLPAWLTVQAIRVDRMELGEPFLGTPTVVRADGALDPGASPPIRLELHGLDTTVLDATLAGGWNSEHLALRLDVAQEAVIAALDPLGGPLDVHLTLEGPWNAAALQMNATRDSAPLAAATATINLDSPLSVVGEARLHPPPDLVPETALAQLGSYFDVALDATVSSEGLVTLRPSKVTGAHLRGDVEGTVALDGLHADLKLNVAHDDLALLVPERTLGEPLPVTLASEITGTPSSLDIVARGTLRAEDWFDGEVHLTQGENVAAKGDLRARPVTGLLPEELERLLREGAALTFDVAYGNEGLAVQTARLRIAGAQLDASGTVDLATPNLNVKADLVVDDLAAFEAFVKQPIGGGLRMNVVATGGEQQSHFVVALDVDSLRFPKVSAPSGTLHAEVDGGAFPDAITGQLTVNFSGAFPELILADAPPRTLDLKGDFSLDALERVTVRALEVQDGNLALTAEGTLDVGTRAGDLRATLTAADIAPYAAIAGLPYSGQIAVKAQAGSTTEPGVLEGNADVVLSGLRGLPNEFAGVAGKRVALQAAGRYDGAEVAISGLNLTLAAGTVQGEGRYTLESEAVDATLRADLPKLADLESAVNMPAHGSARVDLAIRGTVEDLAVSGTAHAEELVAGPWRSDTLNLKWETSGIPNAIAGSVEADATRGEESLALETDFAFAEAVVRVSGLRAHAGPNRMDADFRLNTTTLRGSGTVDVAAPDLAALHDWIDVPVEGSVALALTMAEDTGALDGTFSASGLRLPDLALESAEGTVYADNLFDEPNLRVSLDATGFQATDIAVTSLAVDAEGPATRVATSIQAAGSYDATTAFNVRLVAYAGLSPMVVELETLEGNVASLALLLEAPATARYTGDTLTLTPLRLSAGGGVLYASGGYAPERLELQGGWEAFPLALAALAGAPELEGTTTGTLTLNGTLARPLIEARARLDGVRVLVSDSTAPPLNVTIDATQSEQGFAANLQAEAGPEVTASARLTAPARISLQPFDTGVTDSTPVAGNFLADMDLSVLTTVLQLEDQNVAGQLHSDIRVQGTVGDPGAQGILTIANGYYEHSASGTILDDLMVRVEGDESAIRLTQFTANDTVGGAMEGSGHVALRSEDYFPFEVDVTLRDPRLVNRDDVVAQADGTITVRGDSRGARVTGTLRAGPAHITIPERLPEQRITTVEFVEAGAPEAPAEGPQAEEPAPYRVDLDIDCAIPGRVFVQGPNIDSEWDGNLEITGTADDPRIKGLLNIRKGRLDFLGRTFDFAESTIAFDGTTPISPYLRIRAISETADLTAILYLEGDVSALSIRLESDPPVPQDEILAQVLFGSGVSDISPVQAIQLARYAPLFSERMSALSILGSGGPKPLMLDRLNLRTGSDSGDASLSAGKYLGNNFYVELEQGLGSQKSEASIEWRFRPNWMLKGKTGANAEGGGGLFWKKSY